MPRRPAELPEGARLSDFISLGVLARTFPVDAVEQVLRRCGKTSRRQRDLPAYLVVYYVIALALYMRVSTREVLRCLLEGWRWLWGPQSWRVAGKSGISQARARLGEEPFRMIFDSLVQPLAGPQTPGAFYRGWRLVSLDGSTIAVPDTKANAAAFGYPGVSRGVASLPLMRWVCLSECGTHVMFEAAAAGCRTGEETLARQLLPRLRTGMLCLADRNFLGYGLWRLARQSGAELLWRARKSVKLPCLERLADGSCRSVLSVPQGGRRGDRQPLPVRVIEYELQGAPNPEPLYRLVTSVLDPEQAPALELAALYPQRWEMESAIGEIKTDLGGSADVVLRSKTPQLARQEFYGFLLAHFVVRRLLWEAAESTEQDVDGLSFVHAVRLVRRKIASPGAISPSEAKRT
jgi:Insertion element 4 transposase N-terminal/Transposase DDE domain